ncbi:helix-turn-helix transcriptional regulator [Nonomuraea jiangxiensis]|uniref:DNA binding domain-containing protein, excisionase family n=1 Tax=Nonomuraea jiangxiensis TaxID=633440 RepID=A0A1G8YNW8_9ACTN|nr:helix-turn-helix domain-containing protein [Nonomuraea jiangxiensis]SDK04144.1 DNA binding domain-containing protein, excisionase family [Nonomuraea jiangxiensis]
MNVAPLEQRLLRVPEVMAVLGLSRWQIYNLIRSGELESVKVGRSRRVPVAAVDNFVTRLREEAA